MSVLAQLRFCFIQDERKATTCFITSIEVNGNFPIVRAKSPYI
jgi:hypothetical protein